MFLKIMLWSLVVLKPRWRGWIEAVSWEEQPSPLTASSPFCLHITSSCLAASTPWPPPLHLRAVKWKWKRWKREREALCWCVWWSLSLRVTGKFCWFTCLVFVVVGECGCLWLFGDGYTPSLRLACLLACFDWLSCDLCVCLFVVTWSCLLVCHVILFACSTVVWLSLSSRTVDSYVLLVATLGERPV